MRRFLLAGILTVALTCGPGLQAAFDDAPPIVIKSPDEATTFTYGSIKSRSLSWDKKQQTLVVHVTFVDNEDISGSAVQDSHDFKLPGVTFDEAKGLFYACSAKGVMIPVAHIKKTLFLKNIEILPNANVRIQRQRGNVSVVLEAITPDDPAMRAPVDHSGTTSEPLQNLFH